MQRWRFQGEQADAAAAGLAGRPHQNVHHRHHLAGVVQPRGDDQHAGVRAPRQEHHQQTGSQPEADEARAHQGVHRGDRATAARSGG